MGVQGLWELLAPVGRRVSVEILAGRKLAIDASIWMVQFMKAMRDERGEMIKNAHVLGFFRRICKLLFLRTKPVFVFDGGTPALKRRTVIARKRLREKAHAKIRKTAEKLLLSHLKARKLEELGEEIRNTTSNNGDPKGKSVIDGEDSIPECSERASGTPDQETLDAMLAASLAAEEDDRFGGIASTSVGRGVEDEDTSDEEEMIYPVIQGKVDPAVLAALPPSMQLDLLVQMRERLMAENRQKYEEAKKRPAKFSEMQIQAYLKTVAFRREIDEVQKSAGGRGVGGISSSRIASEPNREFIFSTSFTGDKQLLSSIGVDNDRGAQSNDRGVQSLTRGSNLPTSAAAGCLSSETQGNTVKGIVIEPKKDFGCGVETYIDEQGRVRVSRHRSMGIRMTRDLQWNLDMMKEMEKNNTKEADKSTMNDEGLVVRECGGNMHQLGGALEENSGSGTASLENVDEQLKEGSNYCSMETTPTGKRNAIEISFFEDELTEQSNDDDDLFANLVADKLASDDHLENVCPANGSPKPDPVYSRNGSMEKGYFILDDQCLNNDDVILESSNKQLVVECGGDDEVDWEDAPLQPLPANDASRAMKEEEADIQEAIRRSLEDYRIQSAEGLEASNSELQSTHDDGERVVLSLDNSTDVDISTDVCNIETHKEDMQKQLTSMKSMEELKGNISDSPLSISLAPRIDEKPSSLDDQSSPCQSAEASIGHQITVENEDALMNRFIGKPIISLAAASRPQGIEVEKVHLLDDKIKEGIALRTSLNSSIICSDKSENVVSNVSDTCVESALRKNSCDPNSLTSESENCCAHLCKHSHSETAEGDFDDTAPFDDGEKFQDDRAVEGRATQPTLGDEMARLRQEQMNLGDEQRKLERNAESVTNEMFAECQELLQMFGLPYIIAPMEAEAQCAYMELIGLVDGVVTDDSDSFLFGARNVYKNIFDDRKYVETYFMKDIETELGLARQKLVRMALLLGSDYTEGVSGIGIVNAIEVVHAFPEEDGLQKFREWFDSADLSIMENVHSQNGKGSRKKPSKQSSNGDDFKINADISAIEENVLGSDKNEPHYNNILKLKEIFMEKHRNVSKNWHMPPSFPSESVISAYMSPQVDKSSEPFSWGKPDLSELRKLCWEKFGWANKKADELLLPVLKEYSRHETQLRLEAFYTFNERFAKIRSQRIQKAVKGLTGKRSSDIMVDSGTVEDECAVASNGNSDSVANKRRGSRKGPSGLGTKRKSLHAGLVASETCIGSEADECAMASNENIGPVADERRECNSQSAKQPSRCGTKRKSIHAGLVGSETCIESEGCGGDKLKSQKQLTGRGRGRGKKQKECAGIKAAGSFCSDANVDDDKEACIETESYGSDKLKSRKQLTGRGRGRGKKLKECTGIEAVGSSSSDANVDDDNFQDEKQINLVIDQSNLRRSGRPRKPVVYATDDLDTGSPRSSQGKYDYLDEIDQEPFSNEDFNKNGSAETHPEDSISRDYLFTGGGFCPDDEDSNTSDLNQIAHKDLLDGEPSNNPLMDTRQVEIFGPGRDPSACKPGSNEAEESHALLSDVNLRALPSLRRSKRT